MRQATGASRRSRPDRGGEQRHRTDLDGAAVARELEDVESPVAPLHRGDGREINRADADCVRQIRSAARRRAGRSEGSDRYEMSFCPFLSLRLAVLPAAARAATNALRGTATVTLPKSSTIVPLAASDWRDHLHFAETIGGGRLKDPGSRMIAASLFIRDHVAQGATDFMIAHLGVGPFGVATGVLRVAAVLQAASMTAKIISGHLQSGSVLDITMAGVFCWVCVIWSNATALASRRPPRSGAATASALRRDDYLSLILLIVAFLAWDVWDLAVGASFTDALTTASDFIQGLGFLLGSTLWRDLSRTGRRTHVPAPSVI